MLKYFKAIWNILQTFGLFYDHLVHFAFIWYNFSGFGTMHQEKSGNPGLQFAHWLLRKTVRVGMYTCSFLPWSWPAVPLAPGHGSLPGRRGRT
jgi:hypothetical protein